MAIALLSLIENIRLRLDDLGGDRGAPTAGYYATWQEDDSVCLWKNTELVGYLKSALLDIAGRIPWITGGSSSDIVGDPTRLPVTSGNPEVALHESTMYVDKVFLASSGLFLEKTESTRLAYLYGENWITNTDTPTHYYEPQRGLLRLYPIPIINDELQLSVRRRCIDEFSWSDVSSEASPTITLDDIPDDLEEVLILAVCGIAYKKHDPDTLDIEMAREFSRMVDEMVGPPVSWKQKEARRVNANMDTAIRGHSYFRSSVAQDLDWN